MTDRVEILLDASTYTHLNWMGAQALQVQLPVLLFKRESVQMLYVSCYMWPDQC